MLPNNLHVSVARFTVSLGTMVTVHKFKWNGIFKGTAVIWRFVLGHWLAEKLKYSFEGHFNCIKCAFWLTYYLLKIVMKIENRVISQQLNGSFYSKLLYRVALRLVSQIKQVSWPTVSSPLTKIIGRLICKGIIERRTSNQSQAFPLSIPFDDTS